MAKKVLLIDDDQDVHLHLKIVLEKSGYEFISAYDGDSGIGLYLSEKPDLVILDYLMPGKNGIEVYQCLNERIKSANLNATPVIFLTASNQNSDEVASILESGVNAYLKKPFGPKELLNIIENTFVTHEISLRNRKLKDAIEHGKNFLENLVESCPVAIITTNDGGLITFVSKAVEEILKYESEDLLGTSIKIILTENKGCLEKFRQSGTPFESYEVRVLSKSGMTIPMEFTISELKDNHQDVNGYLVVGKDLSANKALEKEKLEKERLTAINESLATINHQINNPLTPILGNLQLIKNDQPSLNDAQLKKIEIIEANAKKISEIIKKFNQVSELTRRNYYGNVNYLELN